ncbi:MAG: TetR/AcrR family transcriptional regulator [Lachnospiraceae bacterium]|nr:TetR/AcrR family transcriptional regulator [Lachnospiraceae bacterium]
MDKKPDMTTKEKILIATLELATEKGLGNVSLSQIAKKVGIKKPSLYNHFSSKDALILSLYEYLRKKARYKVASGEIDYGEMVKGKTAYEVLSQSVHSYRTMNQDSDMGSFYKFIMSERSIHKEAAGIMVAETEKMILTTKQLFYAMQVQNVMCFENIDMAAFTFAMTVHSIMDYMGDQKMAGVDATAEQMLDEFLKDFCRMYEKK